MTEQRTSEGFLASSAPSPPSFLEEAGPRLDAQPNVHEAAEQSPHHEPTAEQIMEERLVSYLQEAALEAGEEPAAHLHVARTECSLVMGNREVPDPYYTLHVSELPPLGGRPMAINLGTTVEEAVATTARVFGQALDRLAEMVPRPAEEGDDEEGFAQGPLGAMYDGTPFDWSLKGKFLTYDTFCMLRKFAFNNDGVPGSSGYNEKQALQLLLVHLETEGFVAAPEPSYIGLGINPSPGQSKESAWTGIPKDLPPIVMPCGHQAPIVFSAVDIPCPCGNPKHWLLKWGGEAPPASPGDYVIPPATPVVPSPSTDGPLVATGT